MQPQYIVEFWEWMALFLQLLWPKKKKQKTKNKNDDDDDVS